MKTVAVALSLLVSAGALRGQGPADKAGSAEALQAEIVALRPAKVAWREIAWKTCLLDGLAASRAQGKPVLLWVFIDRPVDDARC
jgi:hypothetical protein